MRALIHLTATAWDTRTGEGPEFPNLGLLPFRTAFIIEDVPYHSGRIPGAEDFPNKGGLYNTRSRLRRTHALEALMIDAPVLATAILEAHFASSRDPSWGQLPRNHEPATLEELLQKVDLDGWRKLEDLARCVGRAIAQVIRGRPSGSLSSNLEPGEVWWPRHANEPRIFLDVEPDLLKGES